MDIRRLTDTSVVLFFWKKWEKVNVSIEQCICAAYRGSRAHEIIDSFSTCLKSGARYSLPVRFIVMNCNYAPYAVKKSIFISCFLNNRANLASALRGLSGSSGLAKSLNEVRGRLYCAPFKNGAIIIIIVILTEAVLSLIFKKQISVFGWFIRGLFLFAGLCWLNAAAGREEIKKNSLFLKNYK